MPDAAPQGSMLDRVALCEGFPEYLKGLVLRRRGEGKIADVWEHLSLLHDRIDLVFDRFLVFARQCSVQRCGSLAALALPSGVLCFIFESMFAGNNICRSLDR